MEPYQQWREAGLPKLTDDTGGVYRRYGRKMGVVRAVYPELWRVDIESEDGGLLRMALVDDDQFPETHIDTERPSFVEYWYADGHAGDVRCHVQPFRRLAGPEAADAAEKRRFDKNQMIRRVQDITTRITPDSRHYITDSEAGDIAMYSQPARTFHFLAPHHFVGTDDANRVELHTEGKSTDQFRLVIPKALIGRLAIQDEDGISYTADQLVHLRSTQEVRATAGSLVHLIAPTIKLSATGSIVLDPPKIYLGNANATEHAVLGDLFMALFNNLINIFNNHVHTGVQVGAGTTGVPTTPATSMTSTQLSDIVTVSKSGS